jgi:glycosyltransferase involved in cell wall biosynthesis
MSKNVIFLEDIQEAEDIDKAPLQRFLEKHSVIQSFVSQKNYEKVATFLRYYSFKKVIIEYIHLSYFLPLLEGCETYLDTHDIMFKRYETFQQNNQKHWIEISKEEEFALFKEYNYVLSIQKHEHEYLLKHGFKSLLVPYSFKITTARKQKAKKAVIFIGGNTLANQDSITWFLDNVWDLFSPLDYILEIYGDVSKNIRQDSRRKIYPRGKLDNLDALYAYRDLIAINPVKIGGGLKIKNVEAICSSIALLTTTQGSFGLEDGMNEAFLVADTPDDFTNKLIALMLSKKLRDKLASNGVKYAKQNFHSDVCYSELIQLLQRDEEQK